MNNCTLATIAQLHNCTATVVFILLPYMSDIFSFFFLFFFFLPSFSPSFFLPSFFLPFFLLFFLPSFLPFFLFCFSLQCQRLNQWPLNCCSGQMLYYWITLPASFLVFTYPLWRLRDLNLYRFFEFKDKSPSFFMPFPHLEPGLKKFMACYTLREHLS